MTSRLKNPLLKSIYYTGVNRGRSYVPEFNSLTNCVRTWMECYNHKGKVNRVHPKQINGQDLKTLHYPPTSKELGLIK